MPAVIWCAIVPFIAGFIVWICNRPKTKINQRQISGKNSIMIQVAGDYANQVMEYGQNQKPWKHEEIQGLVVDVHQIQQYATCDRHGNELLRKKYCAECTQENLGLEKTRSFTVQCACPQCGDFDNHEWAGVSVIAQTDALMAGWFGNGALDSKPKGVVRRCGNCEFEWWQS